MGVFDFCDLGITSCFVVLEKIYPHSSLSIESTTYKRPKLLMTDWEISSKALLKAIAHSAKYPNATILGLLVGTDHVITNCYPLYHSAITFTLPIAFEQIQLSDSVIGLYYSPVNSKEVPQCVQEANSILSKLINNSLMLQLDFGKYDDSSLDFIRNDTDQNSK